MSTSKAQVDIRPNVGRFLVSECSHSKPMLRHTTLCGNEL